MKIEIIILANIITSLFYLSNGMTSETVIISLGMVVWSVLILILYNRKKIHPVLAILSSCVTTAAWFTQPMGILLAFMPVTLILFGGVKGLTDNIFVIGWGIRIAVFTYGAIMYTVKILRYGFDFQEFGLIVITISITTIFSESFRKNAISIRKALAKEKVTSTHDKLTGLLSRVTMESAIEEAARKIDNFSIIMMDVDDFKNVNDIYGHLNGDIILKDLSQIIKENIRNTDMAFRYGGDEFIILCSKTNASGAHIVAEQIRVTFNKKTYHFNKGEQHFNISLGLADCKYGEFESVANIIKKADQAMYQSKQKGRNTVSVYVDVQEGNNRLHER